MNDIHIDAPHDRVIKNEITLLTGWYSLNIRAESVELSLGQEKVDYAEVERPDVVDAYPDRFSVGFSLMLDLSRHGENVSDDTLTLSLVVNGQRTATAQMTVLEQARRRAARLDAVRARKRRRLLVHLRCPACGSTGLREEERCAVCADCGAVYQQKGQALNMLTEEMVRQCKIVTTENVSAHLYDEVARDIIDRARAADGMVLDCGSGLRSEINENVVTTEVVDYPSTDLLAVNQKLPIEDDAFDGVLSLNVLEHVSDPFGCARELVRVLKPGGTLYCVVPFLQPEHGYPDHFFNMTRSGIRHLFEGKGSVQDHYVPMSGHPFWTMHWFLSWYAQELPGPERDRLEQMTIKEIISRPVESWLLEGIVQRLSERGRWQLASTTALILTKNA